MVVMLHTGCTAAVGGSQTAFTSIAVARFVLDIVCVYEFVGVVLGIGWKGQGDSGIVSFRETSTTIAKQER